jgi:HK97 family phage portal protein
MDPRSYEVRSRVLAATRPSSHNVIRLFGPGVNSTAGVGMDPDDQLQDASFFAGLRAPAENLAALDCHLYRKSPDGGRSKAEDRPEFALVHESPNDEITASTFFEWAVSGMRHRGASLAQIERDGSGEPLGFWPIHRDRWWTFRDKAGFLKYAVALTDEEVTGFDASDVLHFKGFSVDGEDGIDVAGLAHESLALSIAAERYGAAFYGNGCQPLGALIHPGVLDKKARVALASSFKEEHQGPGKAHGIPVFEEGVSYVKIGANPNEAQAYELNKHQGRQASRWTGTPPSQMSDLEHSTFNNIENQSISFVRFGLRVDAKRIVRELGKKLLTAEERKTYYFAFAFNELLGGTTKERFDAYKVARETGWLNADEIREMEDRDPIPGGAGKVYVIPKNMDQQRPDAPQGGSDAGDEDPEAVAPAGGDGGIP